ncbi:MAG TPA: hypothetical protein VFN53_02510 [Acidobacteriaceae bacterium]|nr:hypothetical protein [Acidobacteriaceae bacterium]
MPDPIPRPTRFFPEFAFLGARNVDKFIIPVLNSHAMRLAAGYALFLSGHQPLLNDANQMWNRLHHPAYGRGVFTLYNLA